MGKSNDKKLAKLAESADLIWKDGDYVIVLGSKSTTLEVRQLSTLKPRTTYPYILRSWLPPTSIQ